MNELANHCFGKMRSKSERGFNLFFGCGNIAILLSEAGFRRVHGFPSKGCGQPQFFFFFFFSSPRFARGPLESPILSHAFSFQALARREWKKKKKKKKELKWRTSTVGYYVKLADPIGENEIYPCNIPATRMHVTGKGNRGRIWSQTKHAPFVLLLLGG